MSTSIKVAVTTGDSDGIGLEVTCKALNKLGPQKSVQFFLFRSKSDSRFLKLLDTKFKRQTISSFKNSDSVPFGSNILVDIESHDSPAQWVHDAATACFRKALNAIATAPLSKTEIQRAGFKEIGHTEIIKSVTGAKKPLMAFIGNRFNVILASGHVPLKNLNLKKDDLIIAGKEALEFKNFLPKSKQKLPIAILGLNPHAGEGGLIGNEESLHFVPAITELSKFGRFEGPLSPDAAFLPNNWKKYSVYVCAYHDQGLIPFKAFNGHSAGVHVTMGIPIIRTSVDHGTAKDIFDLNKADATSMKNAIELAVTLARKKG